MGHKKPTILGRTFGRLTPISYIGVRSDGSGLWQCKCSCGNQKQATTSALNGGFAKSCGCLYQDTRAQLGRYRTPKGARRPQAAKEGTAFRKLLSTYRESAARNGRQFELTDAVFRLLTSSPCSYCGQLPSKPARSFAGEVYLYNGIDRKLNQFGYTFENCVPCCWPCNRLKGSRNIEEFLGHVRQIARTCVEGL